MTRKIIALSDLHIGHPTSLLQYPYAWKKIAKSINSELYGAKYELVLMGDIIDLCYSTLAEGKSLLSQFLRELISSTGLNGLIWIPGNHDYHYYTLLHAEKDPYACEYKGPISSLGTALDGLDIDFTVKYPSHFEWNEASSRATCFTHGHLFGLDGRLFSHLLHEAQDVEDVCSLNHAWIEFAWWLIWRDARIAKKVKNGYDMFSAFMVESWRHKTIRECSKDINHWIVNIARNSPAVTDLVYGHLHESGQEKIEITHSGPLGSKRVARTLKVTNTGSWIIDKRVRRNPDKFLHPDSCFVVWSDGAVTLKKVTFNSDYIQTVGNRGNVKHPLDFGMWWERV